VSLLEKGFGLTTTGFIRPSLADILLDLQETVDELFGEAMRKDPRSGIGQLLGVFAAALDESWQQAENVYKSFDPREAAGVALDGLAALTGTTRKAARFSTGEVILTGDNAAQAFAGDSVTSTDDALRYVLVEDSTLALATARAPTTAVALGDVRSNSGNCYVALQAGTTGSGAGPVATAWTPPHETDGTVLWGFAGQGLAYDRNPIIAETAGVVGGPAGSIIKIGTPRVGIRGVVNDESVAVGAEEDTDDQLRVRRVAELHGSGNSTVDAIRAALIKRDDVDEALVFENTGDELDADGLPPHSVEAVISGPAGGPTDLAWAETLLGSVAGGIKTHGSTSVSVADGYGFLHTVKFTRPAAVAVYCKVTVVADRKVWPSDGEDRVEQAVLDYGATLVVGLNVRHSRVAAAVFTAAIPGTLGVSVQLDTIAITNQPPADVAISLRQIGELDVTRTSVVVTFEDP
jgi:uncharacterized phage protein gp47/JayE